jgi:hypothetical protein
LRSIPRHWRTALTVATLGSAFAAVPVANAEIISVGDGRNVGIFHNIDFVAGFGWQEGQTLTVDVFRNGQRIGSAAGPTVAVDEGLPLAGALEVNHGPEGAPQPGDCWTGYTPDIMPGDEVRLTQGTETDRVLIDPITVEKGPFLNGDGNVQVEGRASFANGTPIDIAALDSGGVLNTSKFRGGPNELFRTPSTTDGWTMIFDPASSMAAAGRDGREPAGLTAADRRDLLMAGEYTMGYGHVAPLPKEMQLFEGNEDAPGPALGCEAVASESNAVSSLDDSAINLASGDLVVTGKAMAGTFDDDITQVVPKLSDGTTTVMGAPIDVTGGVRDWSATFARADIDTLADGRITVSADYVTAVGAIGGHTKALAKDVVAPDVTADRPPGEYTGPLSVALSAGAGETITYRTDGLPNDANDRAYSGPIALDFGTTTIAARVTDAAGNATDRQFRYTVNRPAALAALAGLAAPAAAQPSATVRGSVTAQRSALRASPIEAAKRITARTARRSGLRASFHAPSGAKVARARLYRMAAGRKVPISTKTLSVRGGRRHAVVFRPKTAGLYIVEIQVGTAANTLGPASTVRTRIVR